MSPDVIRVMRLMLATHADTYTSALMSIGTQSLESTNKATALNEMISIKGQFTVLKRCQSKFDCLIYEMLLTLFFY